MPLLMVPRAAKMGYLIDWLALTRDDLLRRWARRRPRQQTPLLLPPPADGGSGPAPPQVCRTVEPSGVLWRPPAREELLRRQQQTPSPVDPAVSLRSRATAAMARRQPVTAPVTPPPSPFSNDAPHRRSEPAAEPAPYQWPSEVEARRIDHRRQGLESLINLKPPVEHED